MTPVPNNVRYVCTCVTVLALACAIIGGWLLWKGFAGGEVLVAQIGTAIGGLLGVIAQRPVSEPKPEDPETSPPPLNANSPVFDK